MILQALAGYYQRIAQDGASDVAPEGFERKEIPFLIVIDRDGRFVDLCDTRGVVGKKKQGRIFTVPKGVKKTSGIAANLLWDTANYVLGISKPGAEKDSKKNPLEVAFRQKEEFRKKILQTVPDALADQGIKAVLAFLNRSEYLEIQGLPAWQEIAGTAPVLTFKLSGDAGLICERPAVLSALTAKADKRETCDSGQTCLVTGVKAEPVRLHTAIKGVWGAQTSGANIVSFNLDAFRSFGKDQGFNAPISKQAEFAYTTALNKLLLKDSRQRIQVGDCSTVCWAEHQNPIEDIFAELFGEPAKENPDQLTQAVRSLYTAPRAGVPPLDDDFTPFFVLGLAPNAARIAIRFWHAGTVGETASQIRQHFDDCAIVHSPHQPEHLSLFRLLVSTAMLGKSENIPPNMSGDLMRAILAGTPYPQSLLSAAIRRCRAEREIPYPRVAIIKASLTRASRYYKSNEKEVGMSLDTTNTNTGYRLGRLFAVLEKIQEEASPGINATIRDRFYGSAAGTPVAAFPHLMKLKNHHLSKLENRGRAINLEKIVGEIVEGITDFPPHLNLQDQGRFAVGYYHQRQDFFKSTTNVKP